MSNILEFPSFTLKDEVSESNFLKVHERFHKTFISQQKGYISHKLLKRDNVWYEFVIWESVEATENAFKDIYKNEAANEYISIINSIQDDQEIPIFTIIKNY